MPPSPVVHCAMTSPHVLLRAKMGGGPGEVRPSWMAQSEWPGLRRQSCLHGLPNESDALGVATSPVVIGHVPPAVRASGELERRPTPSSFDFLGLLLYSFAWAAIIKYSGLHRSLSSHSSGNEKSKIEASTGLFLLSSRRRPSPSVFI